MRQLRARQLSGEFIVTQMDARFIALYDIGKATLLVDEAHTLAQQRAMTSGSQPVEVRVYEGPVVYRMTYRAGLWRVSEVVLLNNPVQAQGVGNQIRIPGPAEEGDYLQQARTLLAERNVHQVSLDVLLPTVDTSAFARPSGQTLEGRISANTVLEQPLGPYVIQGSLSIDQGVTLFIEPGTVVKFTDDAVLEVYGTLAARGTRDQRIIFTSFRDDFAGGDTNGDGASTAPTPGDWTFVRFRDSSNDASSVIEHTIIRYAGENQGNWHGAVYLESASPTLVNNIFEQNLWYAISGDPNSFPAVSGNVLAENGGNGLQIREGAMGISGAWHNTDIPYAVTGPVTVQEGATLTIDPGAVVKFGDDVYFDIYGAFRALGSPEERIVFTSIKDDVSGGDTNGDQASSAPSPGDWTMIRFRDTSNDANSIIEQAIFRYAGENRGNWFGAVHLESASPTIVNNDFEHNLWAVVSGDPHSFPAVSGNVLAQNGSNGIEIREGDMRMSGTWRSTDIPYVLPRRVTIAEGATLALDPGVVVKFGDDAYFDVYGAFRAVGSAEEQIVFTSLKDDTIIGDSNGDQSSSAPSPGDWTMIRFRDTSNDANSMIEQAVFRYAGENQSNWFGAVHLEAASPMIANSTFEQNLWAAISGDPQSFPTVRGNVLDQNGLNGLEIREGDMNTSGTWRNTDIPYVLTRRVAIAAGATLTIEPDVMVKFGDDAYFDVYGAFRSVGTADHPVVFTSLKDDTIAGDTNGDDSSSAPSPGDWTMIRFRDSSNDANSVIDQALLRYGGEHRGNRHGLVHLEAASPTITNSTIENSFSYGIWYDANSAPLLDGNSFSGNRDGDVFQAQ